MLKSYKDNQTGEIINVVDIYENIAITDKKGKMDIRRLNDPIFYSEHIDPKNFFNNESTYNTFAEKINAIDLSKIPDDSSFTDSGVSVKMEGIDPKFIPPSTESAVVQYDPEEEKRELMQKYGAIDNNSELQKQNQAFSKILQDPQESNNNQPQIENQTAQQAIHQVIQQPIQPVQQVEDPIITMFKQVKRKEDFSIDIKVEGKIPRLDFIEMMEDSYEVSIIEFLADELTKKLLEDPNSIKVKIMNEINEKVYPKPVNKSTAGSKGAMTTTIKKTTTKSSNTKLEEVKVEPPKPPKDRIIVEGETPEKPKSMK